ncbi:MAG: glycosyltransferase family 2 protein [Chlorobia bacterium]|nr:glycosyltransferase family 2 protein [Fimbriimonadaceae bacterium]
MKPSIAAIIPTYNEVELLSACVDSLLAQDEPWLEIIVVNAGDPLPASVAVKVIEHRVPDNCFWTACISEGIVVAKGLGSEHLLFTNADTSFLPGSVSRLREAIADKPMSIACSPAYVQTEGKPITLLYSDQSDLGPLLYGKLVRRWEKPEEAPIEPYEIDLTGGQGVLMPAVLFDSVKVDVENFPHYASDHDLWLQARKLGYRLLLVPQTGIVNRRDFNESEGRKAGSLVRALWKRMTSEFAPESWTIMWRLRRKHQGPLSGFFTTVVSFFLRWTIGLPKIIRRS